MADATNQTSLIYRITPELQGKLDHAAKLCRQALADIEEAFDIVEADTDAEHRCRAIIDYLDEALFHLEWAPPKELMQS